MGKEYELTKVEQAALKKFAKQLISDDMAPTRGKKVQSKRDDRIMIGTLLKKIRENKRLSQREVGLRMALENPNFISNIENGKAVPPRDKVFKFASAYDSDIMLSYALLKFTLHDWWELWLEAQAHLNEVGWPDPYVFDQEVVQWVEQQLG